MSLTSKTLTPHKPTNPESAASPSTTGRRQSHLKQPVVQNSVNIVQKQTTGILTTSDLAAHHNTPTNLGPTQREANRLINLLEQDDHTNQQQFTRQRRQAKAQDQTMKSPTTTNTGSQTGRGCYLQQHEQLLQTQSTLDGYQDMIAEADASAQQDKNLTEATSPESEMDSPSFTETTSPGPEMDPTQSTTT